jgi:PIN domain nuclease of toxin-antitoxin system
MKLLLDTHALLWWLQDSPHLSKDARTAIKSAELVHVSAATAWEIGIKTLLGKLKFEGELEAELAANEFLGLPITLRHAILAAELPPHHWDPFDRMLVAQATLESLTLVTSDDRMPLYSVRCLMT